MLALKILFISDSLKSRSHDPEKMTFTTLRVRKTKKREEEKEKI